MIKIWQFLLFLLNCWSLCDQIWIDLYIIIGQSVLWRNWISVFKVKVTAKFQNVNECLSRWYFLNRLTFLLPNVVWWCIIMSQIVFQKDWFAVFKIKVTVKDNIKIWLFNILSEQLILLQLSLVWWYIIIRWIVLWKDRIALLWSRSRSQKRSRIPVNVHLDNISSPAEASVTKLGLVMQHHGPKCLARRLVWCLQVQGHSEGPFNQIWLFLPYPLKCWSFCKQI